MVTRGEKDPAGRRGEFTVCDLADAVVSGDAAAMPALLRRMLAPVTSYCRARARCAGFAFTDADDLALEVCREVLAGLSRTPGVSGTTLAGRSVVGGPFLRYTYRIASASADTKFGAGGDTTMTHTQQEVLILRTIIGLDTVQTGAALDVTPGRVRTEQHAALNSFRAA
ncbi:MAG: RNA polymerase subunit sigma-24 [Rhodococcus sp.]|uniref:RNA polymerase subunit sigma-24 n=1 Tax=Rhodococcus sp. TaxID=1831 RepID=UPI0016A36017|nr:RNA polymerase subunit sigma-24 [Rhodococcus sp. (in: high G+C Gram-positive bacteria)]NLV77746.1 RNA polymerase subunit sigma-24 [Rhodococcus sp. (in: high G+C Gram-positive bacteria)]